jgi:hypothetical protein
MADSFRIGAALAHRAAYGWHAWALLQYVWGLHSLGLDVAVIDRLELEMLDGSSEAALELDAGDGADGEALRAGGWQVVHPRKVARNPSTCASSAPRWPSSRWPRPTVGRGPCCPAWNAM